jgi:hypothetical protein
MCTKNNHIDYFIVITMLRNAGACFLAQDNELIKQLFPSFRQLARTLLTSGADLVHGDIARRASDLCGLQDQWR